MAINILQLAEMLADDSNYRRDAMIKLAPFVANVLSLPLATFKSAWCAGVVPRPFSIALMFLILISQSTC